MRIRVGESVVEIPVTGCYRCGTMFSSGWFALKQVPVQIGGHADMLTLNVCVNCATPTEKGTSQATLTEVR